MSTRYFNNSGSSALRLDLFLLECFSADPELSGYTRSQIKNLIEKGLAEIEGKKVSKPGTLVHPGGTVTLNLPAQTSAKLEEWPTELPLVYEDQNMIIINKPSGISMHPGAGERQRTVVNALLGKFSGDLVDREDGQQRAGVVHRLDKDTTGIVMLAKNVRAHAALSKLFSERRITKKYLALALCTPRSRREINRGDQGRIEMPIARDEKNRLRMTVVEQGGRPALSEWRVLERMDYACLLEVNLLTGRTHQIRVHLEYIKSPVIGDPVYGDFTALPPQLRRISREFGRQALHSYSLSFINPEDNKLMEFHAEMPPDMLGLIHEFRTYKA